MPAILSTSTLFAADAVQWDDLQKQVKGRDNTYTVVTKSGGTYKGRDLIFGPTDVKFADSGPSIARDQVTEIWIRHDKRWAETIGAPADAILPHDGELLLTPLVIPLIPVMLGITAASAPVTLAIEGIRRLLPATVIKVAP